MANLNKTEKTTKLDLDLEIGAYSFSNLFEQKNDGQLSFDFYTTEEEIQQDKEQQFELLCKIGKEKIWLNKEKINDGINHFKKALEIAKTLKSVIWESEAHQLLAQAYEKGSDLQKALFHYKYYNEQKQKIFNNEKMNMLKHQQTIFLAKNAEKEAEIHRLKNGELKNALFKIATLHNELQEKNKGILDSINYAKRIQDAYLPEKELLNNYFKSSFLLFKPKDIISGDFYWYANEIDKINPSRLYAVADCTGHGVPGAIMSVICCNALNEVITKKNIYQPNLILNEVRGIIINTFKQKGTYTQRDGMDISLVRITDVGDKKRLQYAGANNPLWIIRKGKPSVLNSKTMITKTHYLLEIKADRQPIGFYEKMNPFTLHEMDLEEGDTIYAFTDGFADQFGGNFGKKLKSKSLKKLLLSIQKFSMKEQYSLINKAFGIWKGGSEQVDDVCILAVRI